MIRHVVGLFLCKLRWRKKNRHNFSTAGSIYNTALVEVGKYTYGKLNVMIYNERNRLIIGNCCSIGPNVTFIVSADHSLNRISTYPFQVNVLGEDLEALSRGDIIIDDDVWIGYGAIILSGVHIGQGAVIAAGAVVTHDIPPYAVAGGMPANVIRIRYPEPVRSFLLTLDFGKLNNEMIRMHINKMYDPIDHLTIDELKDAYSWFPKRDEKLTEYR